MTQNFIDDGYSIEKNIIPKEDIFKLIQEIHQIFLLRFKKINFKFELNTDGLIHDQFFFDFFSNHNDDYISCMRQIQNLPKIFEIGTSKILFKKIKDLGITFPAFSTPPLIMLNHKKLSKSEGYWKTPIHQDWRSIQGSLNSIVVWIPLVDISTELGPVEIIPKSHKNGLLPSDTDDWYAHVKNEYVNQEDFIPVKISRSDAMLFSSFLVHRSGINSSNKIRYSLQFRFNDISESSYIQRCYPNPYNSVRPQKDLITPNFPKKSDIKKIFTD